MTGIQDYSHLLTEHDFTALKNNPSAEIRAQIAIKIISQYSAHHYTKKQAEIAEDICRILMLDSDVIVREALSKQLKDSENIPKDIVLTLANDKTDSVAMPILESSKILADDDIVKIVNNTKNETRHIAISKRENVSEAVSNALVEVHNPNVIESLLDNKGAKVSEETFESIMSNYSDNTAIANQLGERSSNHFLSTEEKSVLITINNLIKQNKFTSSVIIEVLCMGNSSFFEISLSKILAIDILIVQEVLNNKGQSGFDILYTKAGLPELMKAATFLLYSIIKEMEKSGEKDANKTLRNYLYILHMRLSDANKNHKIESVDYILAIIQKKIVYDTKNPNNDW